MLGKQSWINIWNTVEIGVLIESAERVIELVNQPFCTFFNIEQSPESLMGNSCQVLLDTFQEQLKDIQPFLNQVRTIAGSPRPEPAVDPYVEMKCGRVVRQSYIPIYEGDRLTAHMWQYEDITETVRLEKKISSQQDFYDAILEDAPFEIAVLHTDCRYAYVNRQAVPNDALRQWVIGKTDEAFIRHRNLPPELADRRLALIQQAVTQRETCELVEEMTDEQGNPRFYLRLVKPLRTATDHEVTYVVGFGLDITDYIRTRSELEVVSAIRNTLIDSLPVVPYSIESFPDGGAHIRYLGQNSHTVLGIDEPRQLLSAEALIGRTYPADRPQLKLFVQSVRQGVAQEGALEVRWLHKSGVYIWTKNYYTVSTTAAGTLLINGLLVDETASKAKDIQLARATNNYQLLLESLDVGVWAFDDQLRLTACNERFRETYRYLWGRVPELGENLAIESLTDQDRAFWGPYIKTVLAGEPVDVELKHKLGDVTYYFTCELRPVLFDGQIVGGNAVFYNVTTLKNYAKELESAHSQIENLLANMRDVIVRTDVTGQLTFLNPAWDTLSLGDHRQDINRLLRDFLAMPDQPELDTFYGHMADRPHESLKKTVQLRRRDGSYRYVDMTLAPLFDDRQQLIGASGLLHDSHERQQLIETLRFTEEQFRLISENVSDTISLHHLDGTYSYVSPSSWSLLGMAPDELIGKGAYVIIHPDDIGLLDVVPRNLKAGNRHQLSPPYRLRRADGTYIWVESNISVILDAAGLPVGLQATTRDVTKRKLAEDEIKAALQKERELNELKTRFVNTISHEFRTPLATILTSVDLIELFTSTLPRTGPREKIDRHTGIIKDEILRINELMNEVLLLGRQQAQRITFRSESVELVGFCRKLIDGQFAYQADGRRVQFTSDRAELVVPADPTLLNYALKNLISNGLKYSAASKQNVELHLTTSDETVRLLVKDYGIGIPRNELNNLFQSFYRASNTNAIPGTGLGLSLARQFVELHGGQITVESEPHQYTHFTIILPRHESTHSAD